MEIQHLRRHRFASGGHSAYTAGLGGAALRSGWGYPAYIAGLGGGARRPRCRLPCLQCWPGRSARKGEAMCVAGRPACAVAGEKAKRGGGREKKACELYVERGAPPAPPILCIVT